jgi:hypothetical protein
MCLFPLIVLRKRLGNRVPAATDTRDNRTTLERVVLYTVRFASKESQCIPSLSICAAEAVV